MHKIPPGGESYLMVLAIVGFICGAVGFVIGRFA